MFLSLVLLVLFAVTCVFPHTLCNASSIQDAHATKQADPQSLGVLNCPFVSCILLQNYSQNDMLYCVPPYCFIISLRKGQMGLTQIHEETMLHKVFPPLKDLHIFLRSAAVFLISCRKQRTIFNSHCSNQWDVKLQQFHAA